MLPLGVIVAGGSAERMGGAAKPLMSLGDKPLIEHVVGRARPQLSELALNVRREQAGSYADIGGGGLPLLFDAFDGQSGPLGGVLAGLDWAAAKDASAWLASFPSDTPFLPADLVSRLLRVARGGVPVVATAAGRTQALCALWPVGCRNRLREGIEAGRYKSLWWTLSELRAHECLFDDETAFFNVNTVEDLARAERLANGREGRS